MHYRLVDCASVSLGMMSRFPSRMINAWSSGTGMAGLLGSSIYILFGTFYYVASCMRASRPCKYVLLLCVWTWRLPRATHEWTISRMLSGAPSSYNLYIVSKNSLIFPPVSCTPSFYFLRFPPNALLRHD